MLPMIQITELVKRFVDHSGSERGKVHTVLNGITLAVARGEVCVLLGPSGSGKSTLLRSINGLESFDSGEIMVDNIRLTATPGPDQSAAILKIRRQIGMVFQQFHLFPHLTVLQNITEAPVHVLKQPLDEARALALQLLDRVGLASKAHSRPDQLSGGQQQRVAIARTLAMKPAAILFDEPTSALDPHTTGEVTAVMQDLARNGQGMIVVTHGMQFARAVAHSVHILHAGRILESGTPQKIFDAPEHDVTRKFLSET